MRLGRRAWGCDLNSDVVKWRPTADEFVLNPNIPKQQYDREYPFYNFEEAGLTEEQFEKIAVHLFENVSAEELAKAPGIGIKKAREFVNALHNKPIPKNSLFFPDSEESEE